MSWIDEKEHMLNSVIVPDNIEDTEVIQHRFEGVHNVYYNK